MPLQRLNPNPNCRKCNGRAWIHHPNGSGVVPCPCTVSNLGPDVLRSARIPKYLQSCTIEGYKAETAEQVAGREAVIQWIESYPNGKGLLIDGPVGVGKSHLAAAAMTALAKKKFVRGAFHFVPDLLMKLRSAIGNEDEDETDIVYEATRVQLLVLDDLGSERLTDFAAERLLLIIAGRYHKGNPMIVTTNLSKDGVKDHLGERLMSRLADMTQQIQLDGDDYRLKGNHYA